MLRTALRVVLLLLLNAQVAAFKLPAAQHVSGVDDNAAATYNLVPAASRASAASRAPASTMLAKKKQSKAPTEQTGMQEPWKTLITVGYFSLYVALFGKMALALVERVVG